MSAQFQRPREIVLAAIRARVAPCAVAEVGNRAGVIWREAIGALTYEESARPATTGTIFDLASLTKVIVTATLAMRMVDEVRLRLEDPVRRWLPAWNRGDRASVTIADLLEHASGLPAVLPLYRDDRGRAAIERAICEAALAYSPRTQSTYSDLGFILLGFVLEDAGASRLDEQFDALVRDLSLVSGQDVLRFGPILGAPDVAPTQVDDWRGRLLRGEVDDRNGAALDGVAGHTGLFGTVAAVGRFAQAMLAGARGAATTALPASLGIIRRFLAPSTVPGSSRALGWDTMRPTSSCGTHMAAQAFGHTGFTGTSLWIDWQRDLYIVLLTNRVHPTRQNEAIRTIRPLVHDAVVEAAL
jgi:CubicO group peptidase (beta-lactamase class C family)